MPYEQLEISTPSPVLSWANHPLGSEEIKIAKNVASLPYWHDLQWAQAYARFNRDVMMARFKQQVESYKEGGLGLGLAIARHLVELHGGTIEAKSEGEGKGATFTILLPFRG